MAVKVEVWGDYALFSRPELKVERVSYDVMTPSAARGILEAIYWHPGLKWVIDKIYVLNPIAFTNVRRNEVSEKINASNVKAAILNKQGELYLNTKEVIQQRAAMVLKNVHYVIEAHFLMTDKASASDTSAKFQSIMQRRLQKGQCFHTPYFGCREFPVSFREYTESKINTAYPDSARELGFMLYDMDYEDIKNIQPMFFRAALKNGVLDLTDCEVYR